MKGVNMLYLPSLNMMTRSLEDIKTYEKQALDLLSEDHPHYDEIKQLLTEQIEDEVWEHANSRPN